MNSKAVSMTLGSLIFAILALMSLVLYYAIQAGGIGNVMDDIYEIITFDQGKTTQIGVQRVELKDAFDTANKLRSELQEISDMEEEICFAVIDDVDSTLLQNDYKFVFNEAGGSTSMQLVQQIDDDRATDDGDLIGGDDEKGEANTINNMNPCVLGGKDAAENLDKLVRADSYAAVIGPFGIEEDRSNDIQDLGSLFEGGVSFIEINKGGLETNTNGYNFYDFIQGNSIVLLKNGNDVCFMESAGSKFSFSTDCIQNDRISEDCYKGELLPQFLLESQENKEYICSGHEDKFQQLS